MKTMMLGVLFGMAFLGDVAQAGSEVVLFEKIDRSKVGVIHRCAVTSQAFSDQDVAELAETIVSVSREKLIEFDQKNISFETIVAYLPGSRQQVLLYQGRSVSRTRMREGEVAENLIALVRRNCAGRF